MPPPERRLRSLTSGGSSLELASHATDWKSGSASNGAPSGRASRFSVSEDTQVSLMQSTAGEAAKIGAGLCYKEPLSSRVREGEDLHTAAVTFQFAELPRLPRHGSCILRSPLNGPFRVPRRKTLPQVAAVRTPRVPRRPASSPKCAAGTAAPWDTTDYPRDRATNANPVICAA